MIDLSAAVLIGSTSAFSMQSYFKLYLLKNRSLQAAQKDPEARRIPIDP